MRNVLAATNRILTIANVLDQNGLCAYADVLHGVLKRMASDEFMFGGPSEDYSSDNRASIEYGDESMPTMEELERADFERELFDLIMKRENSPEGLTQEEHERKLQLMHYLKGNSWDSYQGDPENARLRAIYGHGYISEQIDDPNREDPGEHEYR